MLEHQFDGLVGPTHHYAGLSPGNLASQAHAGEASNPRAAALEGLAKMKLVSGLGVPQAVLPPQPRPSVKLLRRLGFDGDGDGAVLERALRDAPDLLHAASSASSMWAANAATVVPGSDARDGKTHLVVANLVSLLHRSIEAESTALALGRIFATDRFVVHEPLPTTDAMADEGAANHSRLFTRGGSAHLFGWGRKHGAPAATKKYPARQTYAASAALARLTQLAPERVVLWQQAPQGIDGGAFHSDVLAVGNAGLLLLHEHAFVDREALLARLHALLGQDFRAIVASDAELPLADAVAAYPFNSQLLGLPSGKMRIVAPQEAHDNAAARCFLERVVAEAPEVEGVDYLDVNGSMRNGGGPACLRLRVPLEAEERAALGGSVLFDARLERELTSIIERRYRDRLRLADIADPALLVEARTALDEITQALGLGSLYDFQR